MELGDSEFFGHGIGPHQTEIGDHRDRPFARQTQTLASVAAIEMADRGDKIEFLDESACGLLENQNNFAGATGDFRSASGAGETSGGLPVIANDRCVHIRKTIDLRGAEKANVYTAA